MCKQDIATFLRQYHNLISLVGFVADMLHSLRYVCSDSYLE